MPENKKIEIKVEDSEDRAPGQEIFESQSNLESNQKTVQDDNALSEEITEEKLEDAGDLINKMKARIQELEKEVDTNYDKFLRVTADFDNYKKRTAREMSDLRKFANENILREMLSVVDNLERAIESGSKQDSDKQTLLEGVEITLKDLFRLFEKYGVKDFKSEGEPFDPVFHQAMMQEQTSDYPDNVVLSELQKGYTIHERLLRPAMVIVAKNVSDNLNNETNESN